MASSNSPKQLNQRIRLHHDQAAFTTCLSYLELNEILDCLHVCQYWHSSLKKNRVGWSGCTFSFDRELHLTPKYRPFITRLRLIHRLDDLTPTALEPFTHVTSIHLTERTYARWMEPGKLENLFGLLPSSSTASPTIHCSPILSFHLNWCRDSGTLFPLHRVLTHPRLALLQEFSIQQSDPQLTAAMIAIGKLKELRTLTCRVQVADVISGESSWAHEVIHELPLLHTLDLDMLSRMRPLPSTITNLSIRKLPHDPAGLSTVFGSLNALKSFTFDISTFFTEPRSEWVDWMNWLNQVVTFELVHLTVVPSRSSRELLHSLVTRNSSHLSIRLIKCNGIGISEMELVRQAQVIPPLLPDASGERSSNQLHGPVPLSDFSGWDVQLRSLKELHFIEIPSTPILINLLSHLSKTPEVRLEHLEVSARHHFQPNSTHDNCRRFCEFLSQQSQLLSMVLEGTWIHGNWRELRDALGHCQKLKDLKLTSPVFNCPGHALFAQTLSELPHLIHLDLRGQCLSSLANLTHFVTSKSLRNLSCVLLDASAHPAEALEITEFLAAHPHIDPRVNGRPPQELVEHFRRKTSTRAAATNANKKPPSTAPSNRLCLIQ